MDTGRAVTVLLLAISVPSQCRRLPTAGFTDIDHTATAEHNTDHEATAATIEDNEIQSTVEVADNRADHTSHELVGLYDLLPTPNIATPILSTLILPTNYPDSPYQPFPDPVAVLDHQHWPRDKHRRKIKIHDNGTVWTKFPNMKHLVEIVPIKHKSKSRGKALAYIVPKSHGIKKKLEKQNRISGIVVDRNMPHDLSDVFGSSEENPITDNGYKWVDSDSDSTESNSSAEHEAAGAKDDAGIGRAGKVIAYKDGDDEDKISDKLNDIVSYFKEHKDVNLGSLMHDVLPDDSVDPEYHVHYIIHKKHRTNTNYNSSEDNTHHNENNINHINYKAKDNEVIHNQIHVYPKSDNHGIVSEHTHNLNQINGEHKTLNSGEKIIHSSHTINEHHEPRQLDVIQSAYKSNTGPHDSYSSEALGYITIGDRDKSTYIQSEEQQEGGIEPDFNQLLEILAKIETDPNHEIQKHREEGPQIQHIHVYPDSDADDSHQSDDFDNSQDDFSSENYSYSLNDEEGSDESQSTVGFSDLAANDSVDSSYVNHPGSDSEHDSPEDILYRGSSVENNHNDYIDTTITNKDLTIGELTHEDVITEVSKKSSSSESVESDKSVQHDNGPEFSLNDLTGDLPNCLKLKKYKAVRKCDDNCEGNKSYTLTFLFNR